MVIPRAVLILGHGTLGALVAERLQQRAVAVIGVRRSAAAVAPPWLVRGDMADDATWEAIARSARERQLATPFPATLLCANPGVRRGVDNRLLEAVAQVTRRWPSTRLVYTGSTAVYADAAGGSVDESGPVCDQVPAHRGLLAIEEAVLAHGDALVLRAPALVGSSRTYARDRLRAGNTVVAGDLQRPFSFLHEEDLADLCVDALAGSLGTGIMNAASPQRIRLYDYYQDLAVRAGVAMPHGDDRPMASRWIDASRLWSHYPQRQWRGFQPAV